MTSRNTAVGGGGGGGESKVLSRKGSKEMDDTMLLSSNNNSDDGGMMGKDPHNNNAMTSSSNDGGKKGDANSKPTENKFLKEKFPLLAAWKSRRAFISAQYQVFGILAVAYFINKWPISYPREENHNEYLFWALVMVMGGVAYYTRQHEPSHPQTRRQVAVFGAVGNSKRRRRRRRLAVERFPR